MPRKITNANELTDNAAAMAQHRCELCGAPLSGHGEYEAQTETLSANADPLEVIQRISLFMADDWKACCVLQLYIAAPNAPINWISEKIRLSPASICDARKRAAQRFPEMASILGLNTTQARAQQKRFKKEKHLPSMF